MMLRMSVKIVVLVCLAACGSVEGPDQGPDAGETTDSGIADAIDTSDADPIAPDADPVAPDAMPLDASPPPPGYVGVYAVNLCPGTVCTIGSGLSCEHATAPCCGGITGSYARDTLVKIEVYPPAAGWLARGWQGGVWGPSSNTVSVSESSSALYFAQNFVVPGDGVFDPFKVTQEWNGDLVLVPDQAIRYFRGGMNRTCETTFAGAEITWVEPQN